MFDRTVPTAFVVSLADLCRERAQLAREAVGGDRYNASALERLEIHLRTMVRRTAFRPTLGRTWPNEPAGKDVATERDKVTEREQLVIVDPILRVLCAATGRTGDVSTRLLDRLGVGDGNAPDYDQGFYGDPNDMLIELALVALDGRVSDADRERANAVEAERVALNQAEQAQSNADTFHQIAQDATRVAGQLAAQNEQLTAEIAHERTVSEFLRSTFMGNDDGPDVEGAEPRRDKRIPVDGEEFITYRENKDGTRTFYVYVPKALRDGGGPHVNAGHSLDEARAKRAELHSQFAEAEPETTPHEAADSGPSAGSAPSPAEVA